MIVRVSEIVNEAPDVVSIILEPADKDAAPWPGPGGYVDLCLPNGLRRCYSVSSAVFDPKKLRITVALDQESQGASRYIHEELCVGATMEIVATGNSFLVENSERPAILIAGGIGVTPMIPLVEEMNRLGRKWELHHVEKSREKSIFSEEFGRLGAAGFGRVERYYTRESGRPDLAGMMPSPGVDADIYCCGPAAMLNDIGVEADRRGIEAARVQQEIFKPVQDHANDAAISVRCQRSAVEIVVPPGESILSAVRRNGISVESSCESGICGVCEVNVIEGVVDHRDSVLTESEREAGSTMMLCCSWAKTKRLVIDV